MNHGRRQRLDWIHDRHKATRDRNGTRKRPARARRDARNAAWLKSADPANLNPALASWVAEKLGKPASKATAAELQALVAG